MKKADVKLIAAQLVECGKGLALAEFLKEGEAKEKAEAVLNEQIDNICRQLETYCEDVDFAFVKEMLENGN